MTLFQYLSRLTACGLLCFSLWSCTKKPAESEKDAVVRGDAKQAEGGRKRGREAIPVRIAMVKNQLLPRTIQVAVGLTGKQQLDVFSRVAGRITSLGPKEGQPVKASSLLFKVDRSDPGENFLETPILSPIPGYIGRWYVTVGTQVTTQTPIVQVVDDSVLKAEVSLPASDWAQVSSKTTVTLTYGTQTRLARVTVISRAADPSTGRGNFEVEIDNKDRAWKAGIVARADIEIEPRKRLLIPAQALIVTDQGAIVYTVEEGKARRVPVKFELMTNDLVEVISGLSAGSSLVVAGNNSLSDKAAVSILEEKTKEAKESKDRRGHGKP